MNQLTKFVIMILTSLFIQSCTSMIPKYVAYGKMSDLLIDVPFDYRRTLIIWAHDQEVTAFSSYGKDLYTFGVSGSDNTHVKLTANKKIYLEIRFSPNYDVGCVSTISFTPLECRAYRLKVGVKGKSECFYLITDATVNLRG